MQAVLLNVPVELVVKVTVPLGVPVPVVTVAVQVLGVLSRTLAGLQETAVLVEISPLIATTNVPLLPLWTLLPP